MKALFVPALALLLTACSTATPDPTSDGVPPEDSAIEAAEPAAPTPAPPAPLPPQPVFDEDVFLGLTGSDLESRYGAPHLKRGEGVARVWQYVEGDCVLHLFLYTADGSEGEGEDQKEFRVELVEAKLRAGLSVSDLSDPDMTAADACADSFGVIKPSSSVESDRTEPDQTGLAEDPSGDAGSGGKAAQ